jgi:chlorobactene lauroyltransferase
MIVARKFPFGDWLVGRLIYSSLHKHFDRIYFRTRVRSVERHLPIIVCANHFSWWDGYIAYLVEHYLKLDGYLMMEEAQLRRYFFFTWAGCFSVNREHARSAMQSIQYAARLLKVRPGRLVWLFPQGEIVPNDRRPLTFFSGAAHLARLTCPSLLYPLASRIEYMAEQRPDLYISLGAPMMVTEEMSREAGFLKRCTHQLETGVTAELDQLRDDIIACRRDDFTLLMHGQASTNRIFDSLLFRKQIARH